MDPFVCYLTNRHQFSMVCTLIDHKITSQNVQNSSGPLEPRTAGEWFHCQVLNILWHHFVIDKSIDQRKRPSISCFLIIA